ncbi:MAG: hypothetical protein P4N59_07925 [Negativicutes bacterium]|nr:hypothetical protein [Negativicutes bacterium]
MNKRFLAVTVATALSFATASAFASALTGDITYEYSKGTSNALTLGLGQDFNLGTDAYVHTHLQAGYDDFTKTNQTIFDEYYIGLKDYGGEIKLGRQALVFDNELLAGTSGYTNPVGLEYSSAAEKIKCNGFYGNDKNSQDKISAAEISAEISNHSSVGLSYMRFGNSFFGANFAMDLAANVVLFGEYVKNTDKNSKGYLAEVRFGNSKLPGSWDYAISYRDIEASAVNTDCSDNYYADSKGYRISADYKASKNTTISAYRDITQTKSTSAASSRTDIQLSLGF